MALIRAAVGLKDLQVTPGEAYGVTIIARATDEPARWIASNAGADASVVVDKIKKGKGAFGYNAASDEFGDLIKEGILDPTKVVRSALQNAASVVGLLITTEAMIADKPEKKKDAPPAMPEDY